MTMPSPRRVARRNIAMLTEMGMTRADAAQLVTILCDEVTGIIWRRVPDMDLTWLANIAAEADVIRRQAGGRALDGACPSLVPHAQHDWWPRWDRNVTCPGIGALERPGA